jgi:hypothetical protein
MNTYLIEKLTCRKCGKTVYSDFFYPNMAKEDFNEYDDEFSSFLECCWEVNRMTSMDRSVLAYSVKAGTIMTWDETLI